MRTLTFVTGVALILFLFLPPDSFSQSTYWVYTNGPGLNLDIRSLAVNSAGHVFAGTWDESDRNIWRTTDTGQSWAKLAALPEPHPILCISVNPQDHLFASVWLKGIFRSTNNGASWEKKNNGLSDFTVRNSLVDKGGRVWVATESGLFCSSDNGESWSLKRAGLFGGVFLDSAGAIVAGWDPVGFFRSLDTGKTWSIVSWPPSAHSGFGIHPDGSYLIGTSTSSILRSTNFGETWTDLHTPVSWTGYGSWITFNYRGDIFFSTNGDAAGVLVSTDNGATWSVMNDGLPITRVIPMLHHPNGHVFLGLSGRGVYRTSLPTEPASTELVAYYPFNGNANDETGKGNNGVVHGATLTTDRDGNPGSAYDFNGLDSYIEVPDNQMLRPNFISIAGWVYPRATSAQAIVFKSNYSDAANEQYTIQTDATGHPQTRIKRYSSCQADNGWYLATSAEELLPNRWSFVCMTWDGSSLKLFVNGTLSATNPGAPPGSIDNCPGGTLRFGIGWQAYPLAFSGKLDDFRIYSGALSDEEVLALYNASSQDGLVAYYPFNGNANDETGKGNNGVVHGATLTADRFGTPARAYDFSGPNNFIEVPDNELLRPDSITIAGWVYPRSPAPQAIVFKSTFLDATNEQYTIQTDATGHPQTRIKRYSSCQAESGWYIATGIDTLKLYEWSFLCMTWNGASLRLYINGVLKATNPSIPPGSIDDCPGGTLRFGIGWQTYPLQFNGKLDDIRIYARPLSDAQVLALYNGSTDVTGEETSIPENFVLHQNYPNPFNPSTTIRYELPKASRVTLKVYNTLGQQVATPVDEAQEPGYKSVLFERADLPSGVYFYRLQAGDFVQVKKMLLLK